MVQSRQSAALGRMILNQGRDHWTECGGSDGDLDRESKLVRGLQTKSKCSKHIRIVVIASLTPPLVLPSELESLVPL